MLRTCGHVDMWTCGNAAAGVGQYPLNDVTMQKAVILRCRPQHGQPLHRRLHVYVECGGLKERMPRRGTPFKLT